VQNNVREKCQPYGWMVNYALEEIHRRLNDGTLTDVCVVSTGPVSASEAAVAGVPIASLDAVTAVNVTVLQADEVVTFGAPSPGIAAVVGRGSCSRGACSLTHSLSSSTTSFVYTPPRHHRRDSVHANASLNRGGVLEWKAR
jgi:hypothetical protein